MPVNEILGSSSILAPTSVIATEIKHRGSMSIRPLSKELQKKAEAELNEVPNRVEEDIKHIRGWLLQQSHLKARTDDQWLLLFLRGCKFSLQRTKEKIDMFYTMKTAIPEFYSNRDPFDPEIQEFLGLGVVLPLPKTANSAGPRVLLIKCENTDPIKTRFVTLIKTVIMIVDILLIEDDNFIIAGQQAFVDMKGVTIHHILQITPAICKKIIVCLQDSYPTRPKGFHFANMPAMFEAVFNMVKPLLNDKLKNRLHVYNQDNFNEIFKTIPHSVLPKEYGGDGGSVDDIKDEWKKKVESYRDWFLEDEKFCSDESSRPGEPKSSNELFGVEGSFRKLTLD